MLTEPIAILATLLLIEGGVLFLAEHAFTKWLFKYLPSMFWIYFLPMVANSVGLLPAKSEVYGALTRYLLPGCLALLLLSVDLRAILRLGPVALGVMLAGSVGTMVGGPVSLAVFQRWLPGDIWMGFGTLSGSWIGGSANMVAVKEAIKAPDEVFLPMVVVDTVIPYAWMGLLILGSGFQAWYDRWNRSKMDLIDHLAKRSQASQAQTQPAGLKHIVLMFALASGVAAVSTRLAGLLPEVPNMVSASAWTIILATAMGLAASFTPVRRLEVYGASKVGYGLLYLVLASIGAKTSLSHLASAPVLLLAGALWVLIHAAFVLLAGRLLRAPMALLATASQANIGGPASAPVVAEIYHPALAPVGLLLAVLGNIIGTYLGLLCCTLCRYAGALGR